MGVPGFYKWLFQKFGHSLKEHLYDEEIYVSLPTGKKPTHAPAGDFDNLYIDMNGLIHPCCHPEDGSQPEGEDEMLFNILQQLDRIVNCIKPKTLLYLSIDGCAPRAKMNQQRSRRFQSVIRNENDMSVKRSVLESFRDFFEGVEDYEKFLQRLKKWDYNVITPGTPFMAKVHAVVQYWCIRKEHDPEWNELTIIFSDSSVPGEGEQKIYDFVRHMREDVQYDPTTTHVIHGLDADLVMLSLLCHEPNFYILREDVFNKTLSSLEKPLHLVNVRKIRNCLRDKLALPKDTFNFVNVLNDFIFLLYLCGNDFLPSFYGLEVDHNGIEKVVRYYRKFLIQERKYLTSITDGSVDMMSVIQFIIDVVAPEENDHMKRHFAEAELFDGRKKKDNNDDEDEGEEDDDSELDIDYYSPINDFPKQFGREKTWLKEQMERDISAEKNLREMKFRKVSDDKEEDEDDEEEDDDDDDDVFDEEKVKEEKMFGLVEKVLKNSSRSRFTVFFPEPKNIRLSERIKSQQKGWRNEFVALKVLGKRYPTPEVLRSIRDIRRRMVIEYLRGMVWVWRYYTRDIPSWDWYYPFHYPPFAYDFQFIKKEILREQQRDSRIMKDEDDNSSERTGPTILEEIDSVDMGGPFLPFRQLMAVLPENSNHALPKNYRPLLSSQHEELGQYYPKTFNLDLNYHQKLFKAHAILPFIKKEKLFGEISPLEKKMVGEEKERNSFGFPRIFFTTSNTDLNSKYESLKHRKLMNWDDQPVEDEYFRMSNGKFMGYLILKDKESPTTTTTTATSDDEDDDDDDDDGEMKEKVFRIRNKFTDIDEELRSPLSADLEEEEEEEEEDPFQIIEEEDEEEEEEEEEEGTKDSFKKIKIKKKKKKKVKKEKKRTTTTTRRRKRNPKFLLPNIKNKFVRVCVYKRPNHPIRNFGDLTNFKDVPMQIIEGARPDRQNRHIRFNRNRKGGKHIIHEHSRPPLPPQRRNNYNRNNNNNNRNNQHHNRKPHHHHQQQQQHQHRKPHHHHQKRIFPNNQRHQNNSNKTHQFHRRPPPHKPILKQPRQAYGNILPPPPPQQQQQQQMNYGGYNQQYPSYTGYGGFGYPSQQQQQQQPYMMNSYQQPNVFGVQPQQVSQYGIPQQFDPNQQQKQQQQQQQQQNPRNVYFQRQQELLRKQNMEENNVRVADPKRLGKRRRDNDVYSDLNDENLKAAKRLKLDHDKKNEGEGGEK